MSNLVLKVGGQRYWGWKEITVNRGIEQMAGSFELLASDRWAIGKAASPIQPGQECAIEIDGFTVITGYIDEVEPSHDAGNHELVIRGRDRSADLVDCVAESDGREWNGRTLTQIATDLCKHAREDLEDWNALYDLVDTIRSVRHNKIQAGLRALDENALKGVKLTNLSAMEVSVIRPFMSNALDNFLEGTAGAE